jgi:RNA polymerase sigma factor (sigma-70 family)
VKSEQKGKSGLGKQPGARLFEQAQRGCEDSLNLLLARHEPLVLYAVKRQKLGDLPMEEAVQAGRMGLWGAIQGYDPQKGYQFSTYAYAAIVHQVWAAVKAHCVANKRSHATREWVLFFRHWETGPAERQAEREVQASLQALVARLPERLQRVIIGRYGLDGQKPQSLLELGLELVWLRHPANSQELRDLLKRHSQQEYEWAEEMAQNWLRRRAGRHD